MTHPFAGLHICEKSKRSYDALKGRIEKYRPDSQVLHGDANEKISEIVNEIPQGSLSLAFLDPYGLHLEFETLCVLAKRRTDLIIFFPDHLDALRNWEQNYLHNPDSNLDRCLGEGADWRSKLEKTSQDRWAEELGNMYVKQIRSLGYSEFEYERISMKGHPLYRLIFCAHHPLASKLWRGISRTRPDGQRTFGFD